MALKYGSKVVPRKEHGNEKSGHALDCLESESKTYYLAANGTYVVETFSIFYVHLSLAEEYTRRYFQSSTCKRKLGWKRGHHPHNQDMGEYEKTSLEEDKKVQASLTDQVSMIHQRKCIIIKGPNYSL